jgi:hypothetical protein
MKDKRLRLKTAGYSVTDVLIVEPGPAKRGDIQDGIAFRHDDQGSWVLSYGDLKRIVTAAEAARRSGADDGSTR